MKLSGLYCTEAEMEDCLVFDASVTEIQPSESVPLLGHSSVPLSHQNFEMAPVHKSNHRIFTSDTSWLKCGMNSSLDAGLCYFHTQSTGKLYTPCPRKNYNTVYVAITLANNVGF